MTVYLLDTDILSLYQRGEAAVCRRVLVHAASGVTISVITVEEQLSGWYTLLRRAKGRDRLAHAYENLARTVRALSTLQILSFTRAAIDRYEELKRLKLGVRANDLRIAAIALEHGAVLVTRNLRDFGQIPELGVEDWT